MNLAGVVRHEPAMRRIRPHRVSGPVRLDPGLPLGHPDRMRRIVSVMAACALGLSLAACSSSSGDTPEPEESILTGVPAPEESILTGVPAPSE